jgi:hypothetical protein
LRYLAATIWEHIMCRLRLLYRQDHIYITRWDRDLPEVLEALAKAPMGPGPEVRWVDRRGQA